jgi:hypothetical protein
MKIKFRSVARVFYAATALALLAAVTIPILVNRASAAQLTTRSIEMSNSQSGATGTTYTISFTFGSSYTVKGIAVDFCDNDPIVDDATCTAPTGFDVGGTTPTITTSGTIGTSGWTAAGINLITGSQYRTLAVSDATGVAVTNASTATINLTTATNPTTANHTFYARITTWTTTGGATGYTAGAAGYSDYGGIALSTAAVIAVTAKVQEQLTFCVYTGANCAAAGTAVSLGTNGVLSSATSYVDKSTKFDLQTNASQGAIVRIKGTTLTSGANTIAALTSAGTYTSNTSQFGICDYESAGANLTPYTGTTLYSGGTGGKCSGTTQGTSGDNGASFYFNTANTTSTYGDEIASATAGPSSTAIVPILGATSTTQVAGIYTTNLTFIATGTF